MIFSTGPVSQTNLNKGKGVPPGGLAKVDPNKKGDKVDKGDKKDDKGDKVDKKDDKKPDVKPPDKEKTPSKFDAADALLTNLLPADSSRSSASISRTCSIATVRSIRRPSSTSICPRAHSMKKSWKPNSASLH